MNEIKEQQEINEALLENMMGGSSHGKTTHSTNKFKKELYHKRATIPKEEGKEEHAPEPPERDYHSVSSDDSLSPCRKKQRNEDNLQGEFKKIKSPTYEREMNVGEKDEEWIIGEIHVGKVLRQKSEIIS